MAARDGPTLAAEAERGFRALCEWAARLRWEDIPAPARRRAALILGDDLAAMLSAQDEPEVVSFHRRLVGASARSEARLLRAGAPRVGLAEAAIGNGLAAAWNELDEGYRRAPCHAGILVLPTLFAVAEKEGLAVRQTLRAAVGAYEIAARFARTWSSIVPPLHPHALFNSVGAAAAAGLARALEAERLLLAISGAATMVAPGPYAHAMGGALARNAWAACGAQNGLLAVDLAASGIGGLASSPYDVYSGCFGADTRAGELTDRLGTDWAVCEGYHKVYACAQYSHSALEALEQILARRPDLRGGARVEEIEVETHALGLMMSERRPRTTLAAKFSTPHALAAAVVYGGAGVDAFSSASLSHPQVARLRDAVKLKPHPGIQAWPLDRPGRVTLRLAGGGTESAECQSARGGPDRPFSEAQVLAKIEALSAASAPGLAAQVRGMDDWLDKPFAEWLAAAFAPVPA